MCAEDVPKGSNDRPVEDVVITASGEVSCLTCSVNHANARDFFFISPSYPSTSRRMQKGKRYLFMLSFNQLSIYVF